MKYHLSILIFLYTTVDFLFGVMVLIQCGFSSPQNIDDLLLHAIFYCLTPRGSVCAPVRAQASINPPSRLDKPDPTASFVVVDIICWVLRLS